MQTDHKKCSGNGIDDIWELSWFTAQIFPGEARRQDELSHCRVHGLFGGLDCQCVLPNLHETVDRIAFDFGYNVFLWHFRCEPLLRRETQGKCYVNTSLGPYQMHFDHSNSHWDFEKALGEPWLGEIQWGSSTFDSSTFFLPKNWPRAHNALVDAWYKLMCRLIKSERSFLSVQQLPWDGDPPGPAL